MVMDYRTFFSRTDIELAYRSIFGRDPESVSAVLYWRGTTVDPEDLISGFLGSEEFSRMTPEQQACGRSAAGILLNSLRTRFDAPQPKLTA